jgi:hypothetical protein
MSVVKDPVGRARSVKTENQAAALRDDLTVELSLTPDEELPAGWPAQAEDALKVIDSRFPGHEGIPFGSTGTGRERTPGLSRAGQHALGPTPKPPAAPKPSAPARTGPTGGTTAAGRRPSSPRKAPRTSRVGRQVADAVTAPAGDTGSLAIQVLGGTILFSVLYAILVGEENGRGVVSFFGQAVTTGLNVFLRPVDPLNPHATTGALAGVAHAAATTKTTTTGAAAHAAPLPKATSKLTIGPAGFPQITPKK